VVSGDQGELERDRITFKAINPLNDIERDRCGTH